MNRIPLLLQGNGVGELRVRREAEETLFCLQCELPSGKLWSVWLVGSAGELRLGIPLVEGKNLVLEKRFSHRMTDPLGQLLYGELRSSCEQKKVDWKPVGNGARFRTAWIQKQLQMWSGVLYCPGEDGCAIAVPYVPEKPFPLMPMFCFVRLQTIRDRPYLVLRLDAEEHPIFR